MCLIAERSHGFAHEAIHVRQQGLAVEPSQGRFWATMAVPPRERHFVGAWRWCWHR